MTRIEQEKRVVETMIVLYCKHNHRTADGQLCDECAELCDYALQRLTRCVHGNKKPTCKRCPVHCYRPTMRERIVQVMRYSGPRMMLYHPIMALRHLLQK